MTTLNLPLQTVTRTKQMTWRLAGRHLEAKEI